MNALFTIVAKNYTGLAQVLEASVRKNSNADFFIFVADEWQQANELKQSLSANVLIAREVLTIHTDLWQQMAFKYNLVEFCTAIKANCFQHLFTKGYEKILYLDPDVYVFSTLQSVFNQLNDVSIVVTPHILNVQTPFKGQYADDLFLLNGTFNLGFIGLKNSQTTQDFLNWWHHRLIQHCFFDNDRGTATDQKWVNLLPALFQASEFHISRHRGMNMAPWNFHERKVIVTNELFFVQDRDDESIVEPLIFAHFSGYDYSQAVAGQMVHKTTSSNNYPDLQPMFDAYALALANSQFTTYAALTYSYNMFVNGTSIISLHRRMYRRLLEEQITYANPFLIGAGSYFEKLKSNNLLDYAQVSSDKLTNKTIKNFSTKFKYVHLFFIFIKKLIGIRRYSIMIRFFRRFFAEENQVFLVHKEAGKKLQ